MHASRSSLLVLLSLLAAVALGMEPCAPDFELGSSQFHFLRPAWDQLSLAGEVELELRVPEGEPIDGLVVELDGVAVDPESFVQEGEVVRANLGELGPGKHALAAVMTVFVFDIYEVELKASTSFDLVALENPDRCEVLNAVECMLPYPSSRFLEPADTPTGFRLAFPEGATPLFANLDTGQHQTLDPAPYRALDGFSPTVQILMHFPGRVDLEASNAPRLLESTRSFDLRSLDPDSPSVLIDADTGERIPHFLENDARARGPDRDRQATIMRPAKSLTPGHHYVVAVRDLVSVEGRKLGPEPVFRVIRDHRPSDIPAVEARRQQLEEVFDVLHRNGIARRDLILAFDFVVQSDEGLTGEMLAMRDQVLDTWLPAHDGGSFTVDEIQTNDCEEEGVQVWKFIEGTFEVPNYLDGDPFSDPSNPHFLQLDETGTPVSTTVTHAPYGFVIPCAVLEGGGTPLWPLLFGHGLFGTGAGTIDEVADAEAFADLPYVIGATNWSGLSTPDLNPSDLLEGFIINIFGNLDRFRALPDRLRQGQLDTLVLGRMLAEGTFNRDPAFQVDGLGVIEPGETFYYGISLGGIMGLMFSALTPDANNLNVDVPAMNFSLLLQRATPFIQFQVFLDILNPDPMSQLLGIQILHELWVRGEPAGYATHITSNPLPGTNAKNVLMTMAFLDQQVSNIATQIAATTLGLPNLVGSSMPGLPLLPDVEGPLDSAFVVYDVRSFDLENPLHQPFIPPLANRQAETNHCDPHARRLAVPASVEQLTTFLQPGGRIENFCTDDGICNASEPFEIPFGDEEPCDPLE